MSLQPKSKRLVTEEVLETEINQTTLDPEGELQTQLKNTYESRLQVSEGPLFVTPNATPALNAARDGKAPNRGITLQEAHDRAPTGSTIHMEPGYIEFNATLNISKAMKWVGAGTQVQMQPPFNSAEANAIPSVNRGGTILRYTGSGVGIHLNTGVTGHRLRGTVMEDFVLLGVGAEGTVGLGAGAVSGAGGGSAIRTYLSRIAISNFATGTKMDLENSVVTGVYVQGCKTGWHTFGAFNGNAVVGLNVETCSDYAMYLDGSNITGYYGGVVQGNTGVAIHLTSAAIGLTLDSFYIENIAPSSDAVVVNGHHNRFTQFHASGSGDNYSRKVVVNGNHNTLDLGEAGHVVDLAGYDNRVYAVLNDTITYRGVTRERYIDTSAQNHIDAGNSTLFYRLRNLRLQAGKKVLLHAVGEGNALYRSPTTGYSRIDSPGGVLEMGDGKLLRFSGSSLQFSTDGGATWKTVTAT